MKKFQTLYGLPEEIKFCKKCVMSNQRPTSTQEHKHRFDSKKSTLNLDSHGVCDACRNAEVKDKIDWKKRESELIALCDKYRKNKSKLN